MIRKANRDGAASPRVFLIACLHANEDIVTQTGCRDDVANGLAKMLWTASQLEEESDFDDLLEAIRVLSPKWSGARTVAAWRYLRRQAWVDARRVLQDEEDEQKKRSGLHAALMAVCLFGLGDPLWHSYARSAADQRESPEAAKIGNRLLEQALRLKSNDTHVVSEQSAATASGSHDTHERTGFITSMTWVRA
ncbi:HrpB1 family type III secretion system apparatus protein [Paraburkholderia sp. SARCC-3016]|uniref:HrpB1 family type III secretion system apparatus protein n=1 Tax=Paraburkholderia sp. SARCC-3016 TaxID=3058611 RepID=UPI002809F9ED|nr:HrpB1 family type III secretion system apparatus protein [Paraburkholderia sp. SARCC-3016]MDQ7982549.1 HrpB1 family type III secretion system apparatus protein [Paraburkholderia sp. SARCC-3016]